LHIIYFELLTYSTSAPAPVCRTVVQSSGGLKVEYGFLHTGGQRITMVAISYIVTDMSGGGTTQDGPNVTVNSTEVFVTDLVAGHLYTVRVTAANLNGSTTANCPALNLTEGDKNRVLPNVQYI